MSIFLQGVIFLKVLCIDNQDGEYPLIIGKEYELLDISADKRFGRTFYKIKNEEGYEVTYLKERFAIVPEE